MAEDNGDKAAKKIKAPTLADAGQTLGAADGKEEDEAGGHCHSQKERNRVLFVIFFSHLSLSRLSLFLTPLSLFSLPPSSPSSAVVLESLPEAKKFSVDLSSASSLAFGACHLPPRLLTDTFPSGPMPGKEVSDLLKGYLALDSRPSLNLGKHF